MFIQPMVPTSPFCCMTPQMQAPSPGAPQPMGAMPFGTPLSEEVQQQQAKSFLNAQKQQLLQTKKFLEEQQKALDEALSAIDSQISKISKTEAETKKPSK